MKRLLLAGLAIVAIGMGWAIAQNVQQQLNGVEAWQVGTGGPAGPGVYTNVSALRGGQNYALLNGPGPASAALTVTASPNIERLIVTSTYTTLNLSLPSAPFDGQVIGISCPGATVTTLTVSAVGNSGQSVNGIAPATCSSTQGTSTSYMWLFSTTSSWVRIQ